MKRLARPLSALRLSRQWPLVMAVAVSVVAGIGMGYAYAWRTQILSLQSSRAQASVSQSNSALANNAKVISAPPEQFPADLQRIFDIAAQNQIALGQLTYGREIQGATPYELRHIDIRITESYGKTKTFIATVLESVNNAMLSGLRIERKDGAGEKGQVSMRFSLLYDHGVEAQAAGVTAAGTLGGTTK